LWAPKLSNAVAREMAFDPFDDRAGSGIGEDARVDDVHAVDGHTELADRAPLSLDMKLGVF